MSQSRSQNLGHMLVDICEIWQKVLVRELAKNSYLIFNLLAPRVTINDFLEKDWVPGCHLTLLLV